MRGNSQSGKTRHKNIEKKVVELIKEDKIKSESLINERMNGASKENTYKKQKTMKSV